MLILPPVESFGEVAVQSIRLRLSQLLIFEHFLYAGSVTVGIGLEVHHEFVVPGMTNKDEGSKVEELWERPCSD